jgi:hypothetical protein
VMALLFWPVWEWELYWELRKLHVALGVVLKTKNALRWGLGLFRASSQCTV